MNFLLVILFTNILPNNIQYFIHSSILGGKPKGDDEPQRTPSPFVKKPAKVRRQSIQPSPTPRPSSSAESEHEGWYQ